MTDRINKVFSSNKKKLITFVTGGDPNFKISNKIINTIAQSGADIIEIGINSRKISSIGLRHIKNNLKIYKKKHQVNGLDNLIATQIGMPFQILWLMGQLFNLQAQELSVKALV